MKSFLIAIITSVLLFGSFMQLFEPKQKGLLNSLPSWLTILFVVLCFAGYSFALYSGIKEVNRHQMLLNVIGICISVFGISCYILLYTMSVGKGKEKPGQFSHELEKIAPGQRAAIDSLMKQTGVKSSQVKLVAFWKLHDNPDPFVLCVQDSNVIGLQIKNRPLSDLTPIKAFYKLSWLILDNCGLTNIEDLYNPELERLDVRNNKLVSLDNLAHSARIGWLDFSNNPITDSGALLNTRLR